MEKVKLAINGGRKVIEHPMRRYNSMGKEEVEAAKSVVESGVLSQFLGCWDPDFYGGSKVKEFESLCQEYFSAKYAVTVNSWTSGLICAIGAIGIEPGDEVIVSPWTMCATATAILHWNAIPVFADIEKGTFCLDPNAVEKVITPYTKAILAVDIFGQSCDIKALRALCDKYKLKLITDTAQAPGTFYFGKKTGTLADVGGFSLNYHKHIHTGEGGVLVTDDPDIAERMQLIRNHAEGVVGDKGVSNLSNMIGYNFRLGEIECAIGIEQLKKLDYFVLTRQKAAERLTRGLKNLKGITTPIIREGCTHAYYIYPIIFDFDKLEIKRSQIQKALEAEGVVGLAGGYACLHLLPLYQQKIAYGSKGFPWTSDICKREVSYKKGICPIAEEYNDKTYLGFEMCLLDLPDEDVDLIIESFQKVFQNLDELRSKQ